MNHIATINSTIALQDNFSGVIHNILNAVNLTVSAMESMQSTMGTEFDTSAFNGIHEQLNEATIATQEWEAAIQQTSDTAEKISAPIDNVNPIKQNTSEQERFNQKIAEGANGAGGLKNKIASAVGAYASLAGVKKTIGFIQDCTEAYNTQMNAENQLALVLGNMLDADYVSEFEIEATADTASAVSEINAIQNSVDGVNVPVTVAGKALNAEFNALTEKAAEIQSNGIYGDEAMIAGAAEFATYFTDTNAIEMMMDTLSNYAMGMSGGGEIDSTAMVDYATGLGKIMTGSYDAMTKKGFEFTDSQKAIIEGTATQQQIVSTLGEEYRNMSEDMQAAAVISQVIDESWSGLYENMSNTPEGRIIQLTNKFGDLSETIGGKLYPYVMLFVDAVQNNWPTIQGVAMGIVSALQKVMVALSWIANGALNVVQFFTDNWSWIAPIIFGIAAAIGVVCGAMAAYNAITKISAAIEAAKALASSIHSASLALQTGATFSATVAQYGFNTALLACPLTWIIIAIIAVIAVIIAVANHIAKTSEVADNAFSVICGWISVTGQFFKNLGLWIANVALGIWEALKACWDNVGVAFNNTKANLQKDWLELLSTILNVVSSVCEALNKLPFIEFDYSGLTSKANEYANNAAEITKQDYANLSDAFNKGMSTYDVFQDGWSTDAYAAGAKWGNEKWASIFNKDNEDTGLNFDDLTAGYNSDFESLGNNVSDIAGNTGSIADSLEITSEDLKYLRDIAEKEAVNRFTTAEIRVEMTNNNSISSDMDLDGIVDYLAVGVNTAMEKAAEGVHV